MEVLEQKDAPIDSSDILDTIKPFLPSWVPALTGSFLRVVAFPTPSYYFNNPSEVAVKDFCTK